MGGIENTVFFLFSALFACAPLQLNSFISAARMEETSQQENLQEVENKNQLEEEGISSAFFFIHLFAFDLTES